MRLLSEIVNDETMRLTAEIEAAAEVFWRDPTPENGRRVGDLMTAKRKASRAVFGSFDNVGRSE